VSAIRLPPEELSEWRLVTLDELDGMLKPVASQRVRTLLGQMPLGYLEDGFPPTGVAHTQQPMGASATRTERAHRTPPGDSPTAAPIGTSGALDPALKDTSIPRTGARYGMVVWSSVAASRTPTR
jgi:hypothetical protein